MIDLTKLTPAPWWSERKFSNECEVVPRIKCAPDPKNRECGWVATMVGAPYLGYESTLVNAEFIALARNAFDVMMRRGWFAAPDAGRWAVYTGGDRGDRVGPKKHYLGDPLTWPDPFTALVEAAAWYDANVEAPNARKV